MTKKRNKREHRNISGYDFPRLLEETRTASRIIVAHPDFKRDFEEMFNEIAEKRAIK